MTEITDFREHDRPNSDFQRDGHPDYAYIGRENPTYGFERSKLHNPFKVGEDGTRQEVIDKYREYFYVRLDDDPEFREAVENLRGKTLGCWCTPKSCHGDVIVEYLDTQSIMESI